MYQVRKQEGSRPRASHEYFVASLVQGLRRDAVLVVLCSAQSGFIDEVAEICTAETRGTAGQYLSIHTCPKRLALQGSSRLTSNDEYVSPQLRITSRDKKE